MYMPSFVHNSPVSRLLNMPVDDIAYRIISRRSELEHIGNGCVGNAGVQRQESVLMRY